MSNQLKRFISETERNFYECRNTVLNKNISNNQFADNPFLFTTRQEMSDALARIKLFELIEDIPGYIIECGVNTGNHTMLFAHLCTVKEPFSINRKIIGFDTFSGFESIDESDGQVSSEDFSTTSDLRLLKASINLYDMNRPLSHLEKVSLVRGDAVETIPKWVTENPGALVAMLYLDFDLYNPTLVALENLYPLIPEGGVVAFDELCYDKFPGETKAFKEFFNDQFKIKKFNFHPFIGYFVK